MAAPSWTLDNCCGTMEIIFLCLFAGFMVIDFFLWNTAILKPMKLLAVFVHEMSHACACWATGGSVRGIEVYKNEGGVTKYVGGIRYIVVPAGYLGGAFWGGVFVTLSGDRIAATCAASLFVFAMLVSLKYSPNGTMVALCVGFIVVTLAVILIDWFLFNPLINFVVLYYGVFIGTFSVYDIYDDLITRTVEGSDAHACHKLIPCCLPRCVGVQFALVALLFQGLGIYLALVWMGSK